MTAIRIFIGGSHGRTGTSLMRRILLRHPDVAAVSANEPRILEAIAAVIPILDDKRGLYDPERAGRVLGILREHIRTEFGDTAATARALERFDNAVQAGTIRLRNGQLSRPAAPQPQSVLDAAAGSLLSDLMDQAISGAPAIVEKTPSNAQYAPLLHRLLPSARLIVMRRDPMAVALSHTRRPWGPGNPIDAARYTKAYVSRWEAVRKWIPHSWALEVEHSDLVKNPVGIMREVVTFCGLDPHQDPEQFAREVVAPPTDRTAGLDNPTRAAMLAALR